MTRNDDATLYPLGDRGQTVDGSANDIRGRQVKDTSGAGIGEVTELLVDGREQRVRFLLVEHGGFLGLGGAMTLIPVEAVTKVTEDEVVIDPSLERVASAPGYTPDLVDDRPHHAIVYGHYGYEPYWSQSHPYPPRGV